jgi:TRAP-type C4-dicarboxylate transport system substrate-binding protein
MPASTTPPGRLRAATAVAAAALSLALAVAGPAPGAGPRAALAQSDLPETRLRVVGGLAGVTQFTRHEQPFWTRRLPERTGGRITAEISPFDQSGMRGQEMLRLLSLGVIQFGTVIVSQATEDPELSAPDLPMLNPDIGALRRSVDLYRATTTELLRDRYGLELLAVYTYPAQVLWCRRAFRGFADLAGRRVRTSSVAQTEVVSALGAVPIQTPFAGLAAALRDDVADCAITGTMSGYSIGLHEVTSHIHEFAITWGVSLFVANGDAWDALAPQVKAFLRREVGVLEEEIWEAAKRETGEGIACSTGGEGCATGRPGALTRVPVLAEDREGVRRLLSETVLPAWVARCGEPCARIWSETLGRALGIPGP